MSEPEENTTISTEISQFARKENEIVQIEDDKEGEKKEDTVQKVGRKRMEPRSVVWQHFTRNTNDLGILVSGTCKYCNRSIKANSSSNGTTACNRHLTTCKHNPHRHENDPTQSTLQVDGDGVGVSKFDPEELRDAFAEMVIEDEQPFSMGERAGFKKFMAKACPRFTLPSRRTTTRGVVRKYFKQKAKLKQFFRQHGDGVCLTTDCWTSKKQDGYMTVTAHFIDDEWQQHKKVISFFKVKGHKGEDIGKNLQRVMNEWGMQVIIVTVDNASSNDNALNYLRKQMVNAKTCIASGKYLHMRCAAHIVNLIVTDGLKEVDLSVQRVRAAVRYIRNGSSRLEKFQKFIDDEKIESDTFLSLDVCTRWNSTYTMLKAALVYEKVFLRFAEDDANYVVDLAADGGVGHPDELDWHKVRNIAEFLKHFFDLTVRVSSSLHVTVNSFFVEIGEVHILVKKWLESEDDLQKEMGKRMKEKYNKYWGTWHENNKQLEREKEKGKGKEKEKENINLLIFVSAAIDPRYKLTEYLELAIEEIFGEENGRKVWDAVTKCFRDMFDEYMKLYAPPSDDATPQTSATQQNKDGASVGGSMMKELIAKKMKLNNGGSSRISVHKSELDKYLAEDCEDPYKKLDVLTWWKLNATRFPILARLARDVLAIPISTVASESAFSTGGRVLDDFRTSLTPFMVEALVCTQDWLRRSTPINVEENYEELAKLEKELIEEYGKGKGKVQIRERERKRTRSKFHKKFLLPSLASPSLATTQGNLKQPLLLKIARRKGHGLQLLTCHSRLHK